MTVLNFPASPSVNDTYDREQRHVYVERFLLDANNTGSLDNIYVRSCGGCHDWQPATTWRRWQHSSTPEAGD